MGLVFMRQVYQILIIGNEEVDRLATSSVAERTQYSLEFPPRGNRSLLKKLIYKEWQNMWSTSSAEKGRHFFGICPRIPVQPWFEKSKLCRKLIVHIIRLRIGYATTPAYLHRIGRRDNPYCLCDNVLRRYKPCPPRMWASEA